MATPTLSHAMALPYIANNDAPDDPNVFTLGEIATVLADSAAVSSVTSQIVSTAASGALDSAPVSTADSKAVSSAARASIADSKAISGSANTSIADSKAISVSLNVSVADSKAVSAARVIAVPSIAYYADNSLFNVTDYGATGDGVTDDAQAIQDTIDLVPTTGGVVWFPPLAFRLGATLTIPADRRVFLVGSGNGYLEGSTPRYEGTVLRRTSDFTGTLLEQIGTFSPQNFRGVCVSHMAIVGDLVEGDGFHLDYINVAQFDNVTFARITGHAIKAHGLQNSWFRQCRWYRNGDATHEVVMLDATTEDDVGSQGVDFIGCTWENNHGTDLLLTNVTDPSTVGTSNINVIGGKFEQSLASPPGLPLVKIVATQNSQFRTLFQNGQDHDAIHMQVGETGNTNSFVRRLLIDSQFSVFSSTDSLNPRYLVDVQDGGGANALSSVTIKGTFHRGAGDSGAQIRVAAARSGGFGRVTIDRGNVYTTPLSGTVISGAASNGIGDDRGDATTTLIWGLDAEVQRFATTLTANRTVHISKTAEAGQAIPARGARFRIVRTGLGSFTLTLLNGFSGTTIKALPSATAAWAEVEFNGSDWVLTGYGAL